MATFFINATVQDYAQVHPVEIDHVYETFYILILGICGYTRTHRDVPNDVLKDVIAQTLHMQRGSTCAAGGAAGAKGLEGEGADAAAGRRSARGARRRRAARRRESTRIRRGGKQTKPVTVFNRQTIRESNHHRERPGNTR